jgi:2-dehydropantoate 2-reductase
VRIVVLGAGAMGSLVAARLALADVDVTILSRPSPHLAAIRDDGLTLETLDGAERVVRLRVSEQAATVHSAEVVIVLVKTWATVTAVAPLRPHLTPRTMVLTLQNGLGNLAAIDQALGGDLAVDRVAGVTAQGALRPRPGLVRETGVGATMIGRADGRIDSALERVAAVFTTAGMETRAVTDIDYWIWRKLSINAAINGLTALAGVSNGAIVTDPGLREAATILANEVAVVADAKGFRLGDVPSAVAEVAHATATNRSSMLHDLETGNRTEVDAIHGAVVAVARSVGVAVPANQVVAALIRARERIEVRLSPRADAHEGAR